MKISHDEYLKIKLKDAKNEVENLIIKHRIAIAVHEAKKEILYKEIDSIERQLGD